MVASLARKLSSVCGGVSILLSASAASGFQVSVAPVMSPPSVAGSQPSSLVVTIDAAQEVAGGELRITVPGDFKQINPLPLPRFSRKYIARFDVAPTAHARDPGERIVVVELTQADAAGAKVMLAAQTVTFQFRPEIGLRLYYLLALAAIPVGYLVRLLSKILSTMPAPLPEPPDPTTGGQTPGPISRFVARHYYLSDLLVTAVLGGLTLILLEKDGHPPAAAATIGGALVTGFGLGLLTNSELFTKFKR